MQVGHRSKKGGSSLVVVAFLAGFFGLSYEILLTRIVSTFFGSVFYVATAVITAFLVGVGIASLLTKNRYRWVGHIELAIACTACIFGLLFWMVTSSQELIQAIMPQGNVLLTLVAGLVVIVPSLLIGFSLPMLMNLSKAMTGHSDRTVSALFSAYNAGAVLCVLAVEFFAIRVLGISTTMMLVGGLNLLVALHLIRVVRSASATQENTVLLPEPVPNTIRNGKPKIWIALFISSMAFGAFQIVALKVSGNLWGQTISTVGAILVSVLLGSAIGSKLCTKFSIELKECFIAAAILVCAWGMLLAPAGVAWAHIAPTINELVGPYGAFLAQGIMIVLITTPCYLFIGPTEIAALKDDEAAEDLYGVSVGVTSLGNALGMVVYIMVLAPIAPDAISVAVIGIIATCCWAGLAIEKKTQKVGEYVLG